jgi:hypothetical protein
MANDLNLKFSSRLSVVFVFVLSGSLALFAAGAQTGLLAVSAAAGLLLLNLPLHKFFLKKRGLWFSLKTVPWLWFYYFYSGLAFMLESIRFGLQASRSAQARRIVPARAAPEVENPSEVR